MSNSCEKISVTKPFLPSFEEYAQILQGVFDRCVLTNQGALVEKLESELKKILSVKNLQCVCNGTAALQIAIRALDLQDTEVITTPFSYVATTSSILWEHCVPKFVDIEPQFYTIDPDLIERAITPKTKGILAVHVFGKPCDVIKIQKIAKKHNLKVIYDAAHAFGTTYYGKNILQFGDISTLSFHATKIFHTVEGGACIAAEQSIDSKIDLLKRFGHQGDNHCILGINAKQSEFHAAMGLANLNHVPQIISRRVEQVNLYKNLLQNYVTIPPVPEGCEWNHAYAPIVFESAQQLNLVLQRLQNYNIFPRRYFTPSLNTLPYIDKKYSCPVSENISERIACLPLYHDLSNDDINKISRIIIKTIHGYSD